MTTAPRCDLRHDRPRGVAALSCAAFLGLTASFSAGLADAPFPPFVPAKAGTQEPLVALSRSVVPGSPLSRGRTEDNAQFRLAENRSATEVHVYASIKDLMDAIIDPAADVLWEAVGTVVDKDGVHESAPKTPEEWLDLRRAAVRIIEGGNLLMMPGRAVAPAGTRSEVPGVELEPEEIAALIDKDRKTFDTFARELAALGQEALRATETRNTASLIDVGGRMQDLCESCHKVFWYPNETLPPRK